MDCKQAEQLFDAYLDGELSPSLSTELGAHRLQCANCRRSLALLEVTGHIVSSDREPVSLEPEFTDRLLACVDERENGVWAKWRHRLYVGAPLVAAAVIVLAFAGFFDGSREKKVAGEQEINPAITSKTPVGSMQGDAPVEPADEALISKWYRRTEQNVKSKKQSGESLQRALDSTLEGVLDVLENETGGIPKTPGAGSGSGHDSPPPGDGASDASGDEGH